MKRALISLFALMLAACSHADIDNKDAVRAAMIEYLQSNQSSTGLDMSNMDVSVNAVVFERDVARATVSFTIKGTDQGMQGNYTLERMGDKWGNVKRQDLTAAPHGMPEPETTPQEGPSKLPPPSTNQLPAGHPPVSGQTK